MYLKRHGFGVSVRCLLGVVWLGGGNKVLRSVRLSIEIWGKEYIP